MCIRDSIYNGQRGTESICVSGFLKLLPINRVLHSCADEQTRTHVSSVHIAVSPRRLDYTRRQQDIVVVHQIHQRVWSIYCATFTNGYKAVTRNLFWGRGEGVLSHPFLSSLFSCLLFCPPFSYGPHEPSYIGVWRML